MQARTDAATAATPDELWFLEHPPVFTLGMNARPEHLLAPGDIPVVDIDRGGQVTYHGPGQLVVYPLLEPRAAATSACARSSRAIERAIVATVAEWGIDAHGRRDAPGVYAGDRKLASIGLRIRRGRSYHGLALERRDGPRAVRAHQSLRLRGTRMTQLSDLGGPADLRTVAEVLAPRPAARVAAAKCRFRARPAPGWQDVSSR